MPMSAGDVKAVVYLVGAGPGDPGLMTLAGAAALRRAAVVVYDYLANPELLKLAPAGAELIYVGKSGNQHTKSQGEIQALLLEKAREIGKTENSRSISEGEGSERVIVRLKGGDPYVFGRGGEEGEFLRANGVAFVEVPGITAGIAAPAYAGIPVTHRDFASTITLITGHEREDAEPRPVPGAGVAEEGGEGVAGRVNYAALAQLGGTLVFYMGIKSLGTIMAKLRAAGMDAQMPAAVVRWGTRTKQQTVTGTIETIAEVVAAAGIKAPAITIVGKVVGLRESLNWFEQRPLFGQRILVTRTRQQASELAGKLEALGAQVMEVPTIEIVPPTQEEWAEIDRILSHLPAYDWVVFTSANGVRAAWERLRHLTFDARHFGGSSVAVIGEATAAALLEIGIVPDVLPEKFVGEELAKALKEEIGAEKMRSTRFLLLRADIARPMLREELEKAGAHVEDVAIYRTSRPVAVEKEIAEVLAGGQGETPGWVTFTSASTATNLWDMLDEGERQVIAGMKRVSIGPITSAALQKLGNGQWTATVEAEGHDIAGVVAAIVGAQQGR